MIARLAHHRGVCSDVPSGKPVRVPVALLTCEVADHPNAGKVNSGSHIDGDGLHVGKAKRGIEGLSDQAGVALEVLHARGPSVGDAPVEQSPPGAVPEPTGVRSKMADVAVSWISRR